MHEPKLRFPGYTEPLKKISCGELFKERKEKGQDYLPILTLSIHTGISDHELDDEESTKKVKRSEDKSLYKRVYPKDLAFNMMRAWQGAFGVSKVDGMISPAYIVAEPIKEINADYLNYYIQTARFIGAANNLSYGVTDFRKRLYWNSFCKIKMHLPSLEEQKKIAALLVSIDNMIDKQKELISAWEERKKGVMQKLFTREVRFKADDGSDFPEWKEKKLSELFKKVIEKNRLDLPPLTIVQGYGTIRRDESERRIAYDEKGLKNYKAVQKDDFIVHLRSFEGGLEIANQDGIVSPAYHVYRGNGEVHPLFYYPYFRSSSFIKGKLAICVTGVRDGKNIEMGAFDELLIPHPCPEEQKKIADCLSSLDEVIEKQKSTLAAWKELKKGLLQQMFV